MFKFEKEMLMKRIENMKSIKRDTPEGILNLIEESYALIEKPKEWELGDNVRLDIMYSGESKVGKLMGVIPSYSTPTEEQLMLLEESRIQAGWEGYRLDLDKQPTVETRVIIGKRSERDGEFIIYCYPIKDLGGIRKWEK